MVARRTLLALILLLAAIRVYASNSPPTLVNLPCRGEDLVSLVAYSAAKTVGAQLHVVAHAQLSRFGRAPGSKLVCVARIDIDRGDSWDVGWVDYSLPTSKPFAVYVSYKFARPPSGYTLPTDAQLLDSSLLAEMRASQPKNKPAAYATRPNVPIVEYEVLREARQRLLAAGWRPRKTLDPKDALGSEASFLAAGYTEVESCASDWGYCELNYVDAKGTCLSVTSEGEEPNGAFVSAWRFECPKS